MIAVINKQHTDDDAHDSAGGMLPPSVLASLSLGLAAAPSFDKFLLNSEGKWNGASYTWYPFDVPGANPLGVAPGFCTPPQPSSTLVTPVMRSCGGAVQGVKEQRSPPAGEVVLNRQADGTTFFSFGSWAVAPPVLSDPDAEDADVLCSKDGFGISACIAHSDRSRRRLLVVLTQGQLACCDVTVEGHDSDEESTAVANSLLSGRLQCVVEANAWEGGATVLTLDALPPDGSSWINARTRWESSESSIEGGAPLVPVRPPEEEEGASLLAHLPGGCWARVSRAWTTADGGFEPGIELEVGSLAVEAGEVKTVSHAYSASGALSRVRFTKVVAT